MRQPEPLFETNAAHEPFQEPFGEPFDELDTGGASEVPEPPAFTASTASRAAAPVSPVSTGAPVSIDDALIDKVVARVVDKLSERIVQEIAWEVIPELAETIIKHRIKELEEEAAAEGGAPLH